jgi:hypothetical protein
MSMEQSDLALDPQTHWTEGSNSNVLGNKSYLIGPGAHPASYPVGSGGPYPGSEADHSLPHNDEVRNAWGYTFLPSRSLISR